MSQKLFKAAHGHMPATGEERTAFKEQIRAASWGSWGPDNEPEGNYEEAVDYASKAYFKPELESLVQQVIDDEAATTLTSASHPFWFVVRGIRDFMAGEGKGNIPCSPVIPDMISKPAYYIALKAIYQRKFEEDVAAVGRHVARHLTAASRPADSITKAVIENIVRHVRALRVVRTRSIDMEYAPETALSDNINEAFSDIVYHEDDGTNPIPVDQRIPNPANIVWYVALRAADAFASEHKRYPGVVASDSKTGEVDLKADAAALATIAEALHKQYAITSEVDQSTLVEITRQGATEMHTTAAFMGGVASQEALKLLTQQFVPVNNTLLYNGVHGALTPFTL